MKRKNAINKKKIIMWVLLWVAVLCLAAVCVLCAMQSIHYVKMDREMQFEQFGFFKSDISLLTHQQYLSECLYGVAGAVTGIACGVLIVFIIYDMVTELLNY